MGNERQRQQSGGTSIEHLNGDMTGSVVTGRDFIGEQHQHFHIDRSLQTPLANELFKAYHFDLVEQIDACLEQECDCGMQGFAIAYNSPRFLENFCERLRYYLGRQSVAPVNNVFPVNPLNLTVKEAVSKIQTRLSKLSRKNLIVPLTVENCETAQQIWTQLCRECEESIAHRLFVVIGLPFQTKISFPTDSILVPLEPPHFKKLHVSKWIGPVVGGLDWWPPPDRDRIISVWKESMFCECVDNGWLDIEKVYDHINFVTKLLQEYPSADVFLHDIQERCEIYAQTTD